MRSSQKSCCALRNTPCAIDRRLNPSLACERTDFYWDRVVRPRVFPSPQVSATSTLPAVLCAAALNQPCSQANRGSPRIRGEPTSWAPSCLGLAIFRGLRAWSPRIVLALDLLDACVWGDGCHANAAAFMALWAVSELSTCSAVNQSSRSPAA